MTDDPEEFAVYLAGEEIDGIGNSYVYVKTYLGDLRMTPEEAGELGQKLILAAQVDGELDE